MAERQEVRELSPQEMRGEALADYAKWSRIAASLRLSPAAAAWAWNNASSARSELIL